MLDIAHKCLIVWFLKKCRACEEGSGSLKYFLSKFTGLLGIFSFRDSVLHFPQLLVRKMTAMWFALYVAKETPLLSCAILTPAFCMWPAAPNLQFSLICLCIKSFSFFFFFCLCVCVCIFLFSSPTHPLTPTCSLFAVWCPGWSWMASISTCLKPRTSRPTNSVQMAQVCSVTLKLSSLATRRTYVALYLSTPTLSVEEGKLGEWREPKEPGSEAGKVLCNSNPEQTG